MCTFRKYSKIMEYCGIIRYHGAQFSRFLLKALNQEFKSSTNVRSWWMYTVSVWAHGSSFLNIHFCHTASWVVLKGDTFFIYHSWFMTKKPLRLEQFFSIIFARYVYICYSFVKGGKGDIYSLLKVGLFGEDVIKTHQILITPNWNFVEEHMDNWVHIFLWMYGQKKRWQLLLVFNVTNTTTCTYLYCW